MKNFSIEYAHIYTNEQIEDEHTLSLEVLKNIKAELEGDISLVVMVDDYSFPDPTFSYEEFISWLSEHGQKPDIVYRESQLIPQCDEVLSLVSDEKLQKEITSYIKSKKYPCSLFIAAWYLLRLGKITSENFPTELQAEKLINILPESFKPFEDKGLEIIGATSFANEVKNIEHSYLEGRLIA